MARYVTLPFVFYTLANLHQLTNVVDIDVFYLKLDTLWGGLKKFACLWFRQKFARRFPENIMYPRELIFLLIYKTLLYSLETHTNSVKI